VRKPALLVGICDMFLTIPNVCGGSHVKPKPVNITLRLVKSKTLCELCCCAVAWPPIDPPFSDRTGPCTVATTVECISINERTVWNGVQLGNLLLTSVPRLS